MQEEQKNYCIILAGGIGRRLWPASNKSLPKQFLDFFGFGRTLLQQTFDRFAHILPANHIFVSTYEEYVPLVLEQLPELPKENLLPEPVQLSTAPAALWGTNHIKSLCPGANIVVTPADQVIQREDAFIEDVKHGLSYVAEHEEFLAMGVKPTVPNTAYGYLQMGEGVNGGGMYRVKSFSEKPALDYANMFLASGEFLWNVGIFFWNVATLHKRFCEFLGKTEEEVQQFVEHVHATVPANRLRQEMNRVRSYYPSEWPRALDLLMLENCENVAVMECNFGWADIGCWSGLYEAAPKDADGNAVAGAGKVMFSATEGTIVCLPKGKTAIVNGLKNYLVAERGDVLLVCPNDDPALVRKLINEGQMQTSEG